MPYLRVKTGPNTGRVVEIADDVVTLGRDETQTIQILDQGVSRAHAEIFRIGDMCFLRDLDSTNGSFLNKNRVAEEVLQDGDELVIGSTLLRFQLELTEPEEPAVAADAPAPATATVNLAPVQESEPESATATTSQRLSRNISAAGQIAGIFSGEEDIEQVLGKALDFFIRVIDASQVFVLRLDNLTNKATVRGFAEAENFSGPRKVSRTILKQVAQTNRPLLSTDAAVDERFALSESVVLQKIHSVVCAPMVATPSEFLLLYAHLDSPSRSFTPEDLDLCAAVAVQLGTVLLSHRRYEQRTSQWRAAVDVCVRLMEAKDPRQIEHGRRVSRAARAMAMHMDFDRDDVETITIAGLIHDVGKLVSDGADPKAHIEAARAVLSPIKELMPVLDPVVQHHERADGSGFPAGLANDRMQPPSRILIVANAYDNLLTHGGPKGAPMEPIAAVQAISARGGTEFDDDAVKALVVCHRGGMLAGA